MAKQEEEEHELHVPPVKQPRNKERNLHVLEEVNQMGRGFSSVLLADSYVSRRFPRFRLGHS